MKELTKHLIIITLILSSCSSVEDTRPNILFIMSDDHAYQAISAYDDKLINTPNIDRLAKEGIMFTNACVYGSPSDTLDECGTVNAFVNNDSAMIGAEYDFGNGLTAAVGYAGPEGNIANEEGIDALGFNVAYAGDNYGVSAVYGVLEDGATANSQDNMGTDFAYGVSAYYTPDGQLPSISVGYEYGEDDSAPAASDSYTNLFAGLQWDEVGPGSLGVAFGTRVNTVEDTDAQYQYEAFYDYPLNDGMTITPVIFVKDFSAAGTDDTTGVMVRTSFSF